MRRQTAEGRRTLLNPCHQFRIGKMSSMHSHHFTAHSKFWNLDHLDFVRDVGTHTGRGRTRDECDTVQFKEMCKSGVQTVSLC